MTSSSGTRRFRWRGAAAVFVLLAAASVGVAMIVPQLSRSTSAQQSLATSSGATEQAPTPTPAAAVPGAPAQMPIHGDCLACHEENGSIVRVKPVPPIAHPIEGWTGCTSCHSDEHLVSVAPGHAGLTDSDCVTCHKSSVGAAPEMPHQSQNVACTTCHGGRKPLPEDHAGRTDNTCWLCHRESTVQAPDIPHAVPIDRTCRSCHTEGQVGALPASHATRSDQTCTVCHSLSANTPPEMPHELQPRSAFCAFCHADQNEP